MVKFRTSLQKLLNTHYLPTGKPGFYEEDYDEDYDYSDENYGDAVYGSAKEFAPAGAWNKKVTSIKIALCRDEVSC